MLFQRNPKKVYHGQQLTEELLALEKLQQRDCAQVSFYKHTLAFKWLTNVLVLQLIYAGSSNGTHRGIGSGLQLWRGSICLLWSCKLVRTDLGQLPGETEMKGWIAGELLYHLTFLKLLYVINLSMIVTCFTGSAGQLQVWTTLRESPSICIPGVTAGGQCR